MLKGRRISLIWNVSELRLVKEVLHNSSEVASLSAFHSPDDSGLFFLLFHLE